MSLLLRRLRNSGRAEMWRPGLFRRRNISVRILWWFRISPEPAPDAAQRPPKLARLRTAHSFTSYLLSASFESRRCDCDLDRRRHRVSNSDVDIDSTCRHSGGEQGIDLPQPRGVRLRYEHAGKVSPANSHADVARAATGPERANPCRHACIPPDVHHIRLPGLPIRDSFDFEFPVTARCVGS